MIISVQALTFSGSIQTVRSWSIWTCCRARSSGPPERNVLMRVAVRASGGAERFVGKKGADEQRKERADDNWSAALSQSGSNAGGPKR
jgi:hypothetical protein